MATFEEMSKEFKITSVTREDLENRGFDTIAEDIIGIPKKK